MKDFLLGFLIVAGLALFIFLLFLIEQWLGLSSLEQVTEFY